MTAIIVWVVGAIVLGVSLEVVYRYARKRWMPGAQLSLKFPKVSTPDTDGCVGGRVEALAPLPSVGRVVHFYGYLPAMNGNGDDTTDQGPFKADVLDCKGDDAWCVSILVHNREGVAWMRHNVPVGDITKPDQKEWWEWPPRR